MIKIFISHASKDEKAATLMVRLIINALEIKNKEIRCTSVPGFKLDPGAHASTQLSSEIKESVVVVGLLTKNSLASMYVAFELGAAWGMGKKTYPILMPDMALYEWRGPISELHSLKWDNRSDWVQLIRILSADLGVEIKDADLYSSFIDDLVAYRIP